MKKKHLFAIGLTIALITCGTTSCMGKERHVIAENETIENIENAHIAVIEETKPSMTPEEFNKLFLELTYNRMNSDMNSIEYLKENNLEQWFKSYKQVLNNYDDIFDVPESIYDVFSSDELDLLFRVVHAEIGDEWTFEQKVNVASVIYNRVDSEYFGNSLTTVLIPGQFSTISNGAYHNEPSAKTIAACEYAYEIENTAKDCLYFHSNKLTSDTFCGAKYKFSDGAHHFFAIEKNK